MSKMMRPQTQHRQSRPKPLNNASSQHSEEEKDRPQTRKSEGNNKLIFTEKKYFPVNITKISSLATLTKLTSLL